MLNFGVFFRVAERDFDHSISCRSFPTTVSQSSKYQIEPCVRVVGQCNCRLHTREAELMYQLKASPRV